MTSRSRIIVVAVALIAVASIQSTHAGKIYWSTMDSSDPALLRAELDGTDIETVVSGNTKGLAVGAVDRKVYWGHFSLPTQGNSIRRANLSGSNPEILVDLWAISPLYIALDRNRGRYYVALGAFEDCGGILRFNMHDTGQGGNGVQVTSDCAIGVAVDSAAAKLYWTMNEPAPMILRANLDGSDVETVLNPGHFVVGIDLDPVRGKVYWTQSGTDQILRADFDGSNQETLVTGEENRAHGLALDLRAGKVYWSWDTYEVEEIRRANLDGSNPETVLSTSIDAFGQIAIDPVPNGADVPAVSLRAVAVLLLVMLVLSAVLIRNRNTVHRISSDQD